MLILVRHAMPDATEGVAPELWELSAAGRAAAAELLRYLPPGTRMVSSTEPKAWQTLGGTSDVKQDERFGEVARPREPWAEDFRSVRRAYVMGEQHDGWEPQSAVAARFRQGVDDHTPRDGSPLAIATHGMAMTTWLVAVGALSASEAGSFWADLGFPDARLVDLSSATVRRYNGSA